MIIKRVKVEGTPLEAFLDNEGLITVVTEYSGYDSVIGTLELEGIPVVISNSPYVKEPLEVHGKNEEDLFSKLATKISQKTLVTITENIHIQVPVLVPE